LSARPSIQIDAIGRTVADPVGDDQVLWSLENPLGRLHGLLSSWRRKLGLPRRLGLGSQP
jgi:hypothetical protein